MTDLSDLYGILGALGLACAIIAFGFGKRWYDGRAERKLWRERNRRVIISKAPRVH